MLWRAQQEFENFNSRVFTFGERLAQLSNVYHKQGLASDKVGPGYWKRFNEPICHDDFLRGFFRYRNSGAVKHLREVRNAFIHRHELDLAGIGFPEIQVSHHPKMTQLSFGAPYPGTLAWADVKKTMLDAFQAVTELMDCLERFLQQEVPEALVVTGRVPG